ncbi:MAG: DUF3467 domain-containing protein [Acidobacteria bacterium]|nr:DUF3467 domain-containing protein [Acidobacteriota bacterium]
MADPQQPVPPAQPTKLQIKLDEPIAHGVYANMVLIHSNDSEFTLDFCHIHPHQPLASVRARVITSPRHVKRFLRILTQQLDRWEKMHGEIGQLTPGEAEGSYH